MRLTGTFTLDLVLTVSFATPAAGQGAGLLLVA